MKKTLIAIGVIISLLVVFAGFATANNMMMGPMGGMMGGAWGDIPQGDEKHLTIDQAAEVVERYLTDWGNPDLELEEVMEFAYNFYAEVEEKSTGVHAFELLVNKYTGAIFPEPGPNMMWNLKYGHMGGGMIGSGMMGGGMMGGGMMGPMGNRRGYRWQNTTEKMPINPKQALKISRMFLDSHMPGIKVDEKADRFYGYYTIHVLKDDRIYGMLSVNGFTGQVWYHSWHGQFIGMKEFEDHE